MTVASLETLTRPTVEQDRAEVAEIQQALLPAAPPRISTLDLAVHYRAVQQAGGDYYDFFRLPDGRWGILIADVSGHGTPAAVLMAITHSIAHLCGDEKASPGGMLSFLNRHLAARYTRKSGTFVTAFYGIYDPSTRELTYARAGHLPPRLKNCEDGGLVALEGEPGLPLGILPDQGYEDSTVVLRPCDQIILYTDGITEAANPAGDRFGPERLDRLLRHCHRDADALLGTVLRALERFTAGRPLADDLTLLVAKIS
ncbi:MAG: PP2C family protein-serine/threonine phosphatase [Planctomycetota bacterium]|jgi:sigma-B regulation protein RsbU (phosphoserine phosphatase)